MELKLELEPISDQAKICERPIIIVGSMQCRVGRAGIKDGQGIIGNGHTYFPCRHMETPHQAKCIRGSRIDGIALVEEGKGRDRHAYCH